MKPASPKQKALLTYLGQEGVDALDSAQASALIDAAIASEEHEPLMRRWNIDKLRLHPKLYAAELRAKKASRFQEIFEFCESERETYYGMDSNYWPLKKLTLKVCRQAVEWLDAGYEGWDTELWDPEEFGGINEKVIETYFVPAIANVAPDFIRKDRSETPPPQRERRPREKAAAARATAAQVPAGPWWAWLIYAVVLFSFIAWMFTWK
jgi:hypothetical protein